MKTIMVEFSYEEYEAAKGGLTWKQIIFKGLGLSLLDPAGDADPVTATPVPQRNLSRHSTSIKQKNLAE